MTVLQITHRCSSCGRPIRWAISAVTGSRMPIDPEPAIGGNIRLTDDTPAKASVVGAAIDLFDPTDDGTRYVSHFATCPTGDSHRRRTADAGRSR